MDEDHSRRSLSPYHSSCFPAYCDNAQPFDKVMLTKMHREDLEDKFLIYADENAELQRQNKSQEQQILRLQSAMRRQSKRISAQAVDGNKLSIMETQNKTLQAKLKLMKDKLNNHSHIHSHENGKTFRSEHGSPARSSYGQMPSSPKGPEKALKSRVADLENENEELRQELQKEKERADSLEKDIERGSRKSASNRSAKHMETIRELEEQVRDLQRERDYLKDKNDRLLQLAPARKEKSLPKSPSSNSEQGNYELVVCRLKCGGSFPPGPFPGLGGADGIACKCCDRQVGDPQSVAGGSISPPRLYPSPTLSPSTLPPSPLPPRTLPPSPLPPRTLPPSPLPPRTLPPSPLPPSLAVYPPPNAALVSTSPDGRRFICIPLPDN